MSDPQNHTVLYLFGGIALGGAVILAVLHLNGVSVEGWHVTLLTIAGLVLVAWGRYEHIQARPRYRQLRRPNEYPARRR